MKKTNSVANLLAVIVVAVLIVSTWLVVTAVIASLNHALPHSGLPADTPRGTKLVIVLAVSGLGWLLGRIFLLRLVEADTPVAEAASHAAGLTLLTALAAVGIAFVAEIPVILFALLFLLLVGFCATVLWKLSKFSFIAAAAAMVLTALMTWYFSA